MVYIDPRKTEHFVKSLDGAVPFKNGFYCAYWGTYNRVLSPPGYKYDPAIPNGKTVEVDLTPVNGWDRGDVAKIKAINIREHGTSRTKGSDRYVNRLPKFQHEMMLEHLGEEITHRLLNEDFLPLIDWAKYRKACNGGASLFDCMK